MSLQTEGSVIFKLDPEEDAFDLLLLLLLGS